MYHDRLHKLFDISYDCLRRKINGGRIKVENEASLQLQFAAILKSMGELLEAERDEYFSIELEKPVLLQEGVFGKSGSSKAKIDIFVSYNNTQTGHNQSCAIELKYFKYENHREPNNRYDVYRDIRNLENYGEFASLCYLVVATDHDHYVNQAAYSPDTCDFDFRHGKSYLKGTIASYRTDKCYGNPITLGNSYEFQWDSVAGGVHFMRLFVAPISRGVEPLANLSAEAERGIPST